MSNSQSESDLTIAVWAKIDAACDRFESAWQAGQRPSITDFLVGASNITTISDSGRANLLRELILLDVEYRGINGEQVPRSEYEALFPDAQEVLDEVFNCDLIQTVFASDLDDPEQTETLPNKPSSATTVWEEGAVIGSYRILEPLGKGGMGTVYRAAHMLIDCERAIKFIKPSLANDAQAVKRFLQEAQTTIVHLSHPNIVKTYDLNREGERIYLVMEVLNGEDLLRLVRRRGTLSAAEAVRIIEQAATGLDYAHGLGFVHRDIKPQNIMLTTNGTVKIMDLGLVRALEAADTQTPLNATKSLKVHVDGTFSRKIDSEQLTEVSTLLGTLSYMSPEQANNPRIADGRSDLYSLGATFYFLLTGEHPFKGKDSSEVLKNVLTNKFTPLRERRPEIPAALESIVHKLLAGRPENRFDSGKQLAKTLRNWRLQERLDREALEVNEPVTVETKEDLKIVLFKLGLISQSDWDSAIKSAKAGLHSKTGIFTSATSLERILEALESLYDESRGQRGVSAWQKQAILSGNADFLKLPQHTLIDRIGVDWKGEIFLGRNLKTGNLETIRTFATEAATEPNADKSRTASDSSNEIAERIQFFKTEIPKIAAVQDPVFPAILRFYNWHNRLYKLIAYVTTDYITGLTGQDIVQSASFPDIGDRAEWALRAITKIARGIEVAHEHNVLHMDINPKAVLFDQSGEPRLQDLGIALLVSKRNARSASASMSLGLDLDLDTVSPALAGTPCVMPPEQWLDLELASPAVDVYGLGCTLCYFLTGEFPFYSDDLQALEKQVLYTPVEESAAVKKIAEPVRSTVVKLLAKEPADRPTAGEAADDLECLLDLISGKSGSNTTKNSWFGQIFSSGWWGGKQDA